MNDEAESSHAGLPRSHLDSSSANAESQRARDDGHAVEDIDEEGEEGEEGEEDEDEERRQREQRVKQRKLDAKRKRVVFLDHLLRELDGVVLLELILLYHLDCSFFWFIVRALIHVTLLTPLPDLQLARQHDEQRPFLPMVLFPFAINFILHLVCRPPSAGEETRGYLHGGLMIDFIGQQGPTSKWKLAALDIGILGLQLVMVSVHAKRRHLRKKLASISAASPGTSPADGAASTAEAENTGLSNADREQDADAEERGMLRRTDTLSDMGADPDEEDGLLSSSSEFVHGDALDALSSGQCVIGEFTLIDTLLQEHQGYQAYRQTRSETASGASLSPNTLRQLHSIRIRFGVGGG